MSPIATAYALVLVVCCVSLVAVRGDAGPNPASQFRIQILADGSDGLGDLFPVCTDSVVPDPSGSNAVDHDGVCGGLESASFFVGEEESDFFFSVYKTSESADYGMDVHLLAACHSKSMPGKSLLTVNFETTDRVLHLSTAAGLTGPNCQVDIPLDDTSAFLQCKEPLAECETAASDAHVELETQLDNIQAAQAEGQAARERLENERLQLSEELIKLKHEYELVLQKYAESNATAENAKLKASNSLIALQDEHDKLLAKLDVLQQSFDNQQAKASELAAQHDSLKAAHAELKTQSAALEEDNARVRGKLNAVGDENEQLRKAFAGTKDELESRFVAVQANLTELSTTHAAEVRARQRAERSEEELNGRVQQLSVHKQELEGALENLKRELSGLRSSESSLRSIVQSEPHELIETLIEHKTELVLVTVVLMSLTVAATVLCVGRGERAPVDTDLLSPPQQDAEAVDKLKTLLDEAKQQSQQFENQLNELTAKTDTLQAKLDNAEQTTLLQVERYDGDIKEYHSEVTELQKRLNTEQQQASFGAISPPLVCSDCLW